MDNKNQCEKKKKTIKKLKHQMDGVTSYYRNPLIKVINAEKVLMRVGV